MNNVLSIWDLLLTPLYIFFIYVIGFTIKTTQIIKHPEYKYFLQGLTFKIFGGIAFALVYVFYYDGGDTHTYFKDSRTLGKLFLTNIEPALSILANNLTSENWSVFNSETGFLHWYVWKDPHTFTVVRYSMFFNLLGSQTYIPTTIIISCLSYIGIWKVFRLFHNLYSEHSKFLAIAILFMPSFVFWGSGIMKDTYIVGATCWITYNFYQIAIANKKIITNIILFVINFIIILNIKPYVIGCLVPSMLFWINQAYIQKIKSTLFRIIFLPFILTVFGVSGLFLYSNVGNSMGDYGSVDKAFEKARITQQDLLREGQYGSNNYNLGELDGSLSGMIKIAPLAIFTTLYRPFVTEIGNPMMALSAIENLSLLIFTLIIFYKTKPRRMINILRKHPILQYSLIFSIMLAFGVGIATANFGALVRYKIPLVPFYFSALFLIYQISEKDRLVKLK